MKIVQMTAAAGALILVTLPAGAVDTSLAVGSSDTTFRITGFVPVICNARVSASTVPTAPGTVALGQLKEFCNNAGGYRVYADYSPSLVNSKLVIDGKDVALDESGTALISSSSLPNIDSHDLELNIADEAAPGGAISFRIETL